MRRLPFTSRRSLWLAGALALVLGVVFAVGFSVLREVGVPAAGETTLETLDVYARVPSVETSWTRRATGCFASPKEDPSGRLPA
jgi:hypothetical protein